MLDCKDVTEIIANIYMPITNTNLNHFTIGIYRDYDANINNAIKVSTFSHGMQHGPQRQNWMQHGPEVSMGSTVGKALC